MELPGGTGRRWTSAITMPTSRMTTFRLADDAAASPTRSTGEMNGTYARRLLGLTIFVLAGVVWVLSASVAIVAANHDGLHTGCWRSGPWPTGMGSVESAPVGARFSWWPVGRECEWRSADGTRSVIVQGDSWVATSVLVGLGALSASGVVIALLPARKERAAR